jgi:hypothetical protein
MEAIFELIFLAIKVLVELLGVVLQFTLCIAEMAAAPLRFLFSSDYRRRVRKDWDGNRARCLGDLVGGTLVLLILGGLLCYWIQLAPLLVRILW